VANFYAIIFDPTIVDTAKLHKLIDDSPKFFDWWHYLNSAYIVKTNDNLNGVQAFLQKSWPNNRYFIIKVNPLYNDGWINPDAYEWFKR
jgi:hypothetical protein